MANMKVMGASAIGLLLFGISSAIFEPVFSTHSANAAVPRASQAAIKVEQLSPAQRATMPNTTRVALRNGLTVTLGFLRAYHQRREARFADAARLGQSVGRAGAAARSTIGVSNALNNAARSSAAAPKMVPMKPVLEAAADYRSFCGGADPSGCLYFPAQTILSRLYGYAPDFFFASDPLVTDANACTSEGGIMYGGSCEYPYPISYDAGFNPGSPPAGKPIGTGVTSQTNCGAPFTASVDPKGAIRMQFTPETASFTTGQNAPTCVVRVYLPPG